MLLKSGRELLPPRSKKQSSSISNDTTSGKAVTTPSMPRKSKSKQQKEVIMSTPSTALLTTIAPSCSKSRTTGSVRSTSSTRSGPLRAIQNVFKVAASPLKSRSRLLPPPHKITIKLQEPRPFLSPLPAVTSLPAAASTAVATTSTPKSNNDIVNKNTNTTTKITSAAAAMRSQADIPRFIIINLNYYDDVPLLDMESPLKRRGVDAPSSSIIINNNHSLHEA